MKNGKTVTGRYKYYESAAANADGCPVLTYEDACRQTGTKFIPVALAYG